MFTRDNTPNSSVDLVRKELLWETREETLLQVWCENAKARSINHKRLGKRQKLKYTVFGIPSIAIPIVLGGLSQAFPCHSILTQGGLAIAALFSSINLFFNFGAKEQLHFEFCNKYFTLCTEIKSELSKPKSKRQSCDAFLEKIKGEYNNLVSQSPVL